MLVEHSTVHTLMHDEYKSLCNQSVVESRHIVPSRLSVRTADK